MTAGSRDALIQELDRSVTEVLAYFAGPGRTSKARVDQWETRDVLQHAQEDDPFHAADDLRAIPSKRLQGGAVLRLDDAADDRAAALAKVRIPRREQEPVDALPAIGRQHLAVMREDDVRAHRRAARDPVRPGVRVQPLDGDVLPLAAGQRRGDLAAESVEHPHGPVTAQGRRHVRAGLQGRRRPHRFARSGETVAEGRGR